MLFLWFTAGSSGAVDRLDGMELSVPRLTGGKLLADEDASRKGELSYVQPPRIRLAYTAEELKDRVRRIPPPSDTRSENKRLPPGPPVAIRGEEQDFVTASCADLTMRLVHLLRKVNALKKREKSLFSGLTEVEKLELEEANQQLSAVKTVLKARCSAPSPR